MKINHDLRHKISVVEAQGKALIEQKVELEAGAQARGQEVAALRQEIARLRERLQGELPAPSSDEPLPQPPSPAEVTQHKRSLLYRLDSLNVRVLLKAIATQTRSLTKLGSKSLKNKAKKKSQNLRFL